MCQIQTHSKGDIMEYILKNGIVYDPANEINGEKKDVMFKDGIIVDDVSSDAKVLDVTDKIVMPAGVDPHAHVAGPKLVVGRLYRPEDSRRGVTQKTKVLRSESGFSIPSCPATGYRYSRLGYGTVVEAAMPPLEAKHTHEEIATIPQDNNIEDLSAFISAWLKISKGYGIKIVNPCGSEAWGWGMNVHGVNDKAPYFDVTSKEVIQALAKANEYLNLPHSIHIHPNDLGHPGNVPTTIETMDAVKDIKKSSKATIRDQVMHLCHLQFHAYTGNSWRDAASGAEEIAKYINKNDHITCDVGQVTLDETTTMTADAPMEYDLFKLSGLKWTNKDIECETAAGIIPCIYSGKSPVNSLQWAIGLELFLHIDDPWKVCLTTDHPNAGPFTRYPRIISWLMSNQRRTEMIENREVHKWVEKRTTLPTLDREYDFYDIAVISRAAPARIYGFEDRGQLTPGYRADIAVYDINPNEIDPSRQYAEIEKGFNVADYTIKDGQILVKDKEIVKVKESQNIWVNVKGYEAQEQKVINDIMPFFTQYYSVKWENYPVHDHYVSNPIRVDVEK